MNAQRNGGTCTPSTGIKVLSVANVSKALNQSMENVLPLQLCLVVLKAMTTMAMQIGVLFVIIQLATLGGAMSNKWTSLL